MNHTAKFSLKSAFDVAVVVIFLGIVAVPWSHFFSGKMSLGNQLAWPSASHWLGTDNLGRDLLIRLSDAMLHAVLPLWLGILVITTLSMGLTVFYLSTAKDTARSHFFHSVTDSVLSGGGAIPVVLLAFCLAVIFETTQLWMIIVSVGTILSIHSFLYMKGLYLKCEKLGYWQAHQATGGTKLARIWSYGVCRDWLRGLAGNLAFYLKVGVTVEASLSYLGFGIQEPHASFGNMLASHFDSYLHGNPLILITIAFGLVVSAYAPAAFFRLLMSARGLVAMGVSTRSAPLPVSLIS